MRDDAAHQTDGDDRHVDVNELVALLRAFYAEEYQRDQHGEPSGVWTLLTQLTRGLGVVILDVNDPARWLAPDSDWRSIVDGDGLSEECRRRGRRVRRGNGLGEVDE